jgi:beta-1,4-mannosyl-glycoprotein beta-1,4-N-acetylglucosaminyltransferase
MKIINVFPFYNEIEMLEYKLSVLNDYVDYFVLAESTHTHVGSETELFFQKVKDDEVFSKYKDKILHMIITDYPYKKPNINYQQNQQWENEHYQKNYLSKSFEILQLQDEDVIIAGDLDEIPNPEILKKIKNNEFVVNDFYSLKMDIYYFNLLTLSP